MEIKLTLNGERIVQDIEPDLLLIDFVRKNGCYSVKLVVIQVTVDYVRFY